MVWRELQRCSFAAGNSQNGRGRLGRRKGRLGGRKKDRLGRRKVRLGGRIKIDWGGGKRKVRPGRKKDRLAGGKVAIGSTMGTRKSQIWRKVRLIITTKTAGLITIKTAEYGTFRIHLVSPGLICVHSLGLPPCPIT